MARYYDGDTALFNKYWETVFYDGGEWMVEAPALSVGAIYDKNLTLIKGEFHPTLEDGTASPLPNSTLGNLNGLTEASMDFLQGLKAKKKGILIEDNKHMLLVVMNEIRFSNDPTVQGYLAVAADMRFYMQSLCNSTLHSHTHTHTYINKHC